MRFRALLVGLVAALTVTAAVPAWAQIEKIETGDLRLVYFTPTETYLVPHAARTFLNADTFLKALFDYTPTRKTTVLLADFSDYGNAAAGTVPHNTIRVQVAPLSYAFETITATERMNTIMNHEFVHVIAMDQAAHRDRVFRSIFFGKVAPVGDEPESVAYFYLTSPRVAAPRWYHEGVAVLLDTFMDGGIGRAQGGYDEMVFRSMVRDHARFYDPLGLAAEGTKIDFQVEVNSYLYGTRFMTWLAYHYSPEQVIEWVSRKDGSRAYYASAFQQVFGVTLESAWQAWMAWEQTFQQANLEQIRKFPVTPTTDLSPRGLGSVSRAFYDEASGTIYAAFNYPGIVAHMGAIDVKTGATSRIADIKGPLIYQVTSIAWDPAKRRLFYTTDNGAHRDLVSLDPATGRRTGLQKDTRIGDLAFDRADDTLWGIRSLDGLDTIVEIAPPYTSWKQIATLPYGTIVYDLDVSPDGTMLSASFGEISGKQDVRVLSVADLRAGRVQPIATFDFNGGVPDNFVFSPDNKYLYGSSYYTGASNIFRYEIATKKVECVSNAETGFFRPIPLGHDQLIVFRYTGQGFVPARMTAAPLQDVNPIVFLGERAVDAHPVLKTWAVGSPAAIPYDAMPKTQGVYRLGGGLELESIYPMVQGYKNAGAVGARANFSDPLQLNRLRVSASFTPASDAVTGAERVHLDSAYERYDWTAKAAYNDADFYDLFGPTKTSRKGYKIALAHHNTLLWDDPRRLTLDVEGRVAGHLDRLPEYQNVPVSINSLATVDATLQFSGLRSSLGHVDDETGRLWTMESQTDVVHGDAFTRVHATYDQGVGLPLPHSSIWIRTAAGFSPQDPSDPFANFYFGAFGNNYVDHGAVQRYRDFSAFPGAGLNEIAGRNFARGMVEWNLPPVRFSRIGTPGAYLSWLRPAVFASVLGTNLDRSEDRRRATSIGGQVDLRFTILSALDMTLSAGAAVRFANDVPARRELMLSLALLR